MSSSSCWWAGCWFYSRSPAATFLTLGGPGGLHYRWWSSSGDWERGAERVSADWRRNGWSQKSGEARSSRGGWLCFCARGRHFDGQDGFCSPRAASSCFEDWSPPQSWFGPLELRELLRERSGDKW